jgi:Ca2+-binding RTX toxin-like protein
VIIQGGGGEDVFLIENGTEALTLKGGGGADVFRIDSGTATILGQGGDDVAEIDECATAVLRGVELIVAV